MSEKVVIDEMAKNMEKSLQTFQKELSKVRTGRATTALVEPVHVDYYGSNVPIQQIANVTTPDAKTIQIVPWEVTMLAGIEKAILAANIGLTPQNDGKVIRINLPPLTEERRKDMVKAIKKMGEDTKIAIRNHRRDANDRFKDLEKSKTLSQDGAKKALADVQKKTDDKIVEVDKLISSKEKEVMTI